MKKIFIILIASISINSIAYDMHEDACSDESRKMYSSSSNIFGFIPVASTLIAIAGAITDAQCPQLEPWQKDLNKLKHEMKSQITREIGDVNSRIDTISARLDGLSAVLGEEHFNVREELNQLYGLSEENQKNSFEEQVDRFNSEIYDTYKSALDYKPSLLARVQATHYEDKSYDEIANFKYLYSTDDKFRFLFSNAPKILTGFKNILPNTSAATLRKSLDAMCKDYTKISGDIIQKRAICNDDIVYITNAVYFSEVKARLILEDIMQTEHRYHKTLERSDWLGTAGNAMQVFDKTKDPAISWEGDAAAKYASKIISDHRKMITDALLGNNGDKLYRAVAKDELSPELQAISEKKDFRCPGGILHWWQNTSNNLPYLEVACNYMYNKQKNAYSSTKSKFFLGNKPDYRNMNWANVLGALTLFTLSKEYLMTNRIDTQVSEDGDYRKASFNLKSDLPLEGNSQELGALTTRGVYNIQSNLYDERSTKKYESIWLRPLQSKTQIDPDKNYMHTHFFTEVWARNEPKKDSNVDNDRYADQYGGMFQDAKRIFLSFKKDDFTYAFGLLVKTSDGKFGKFGSVNLECLSSFVCEVPTLPNEPKKQGSRIVWKDGTYAQISGGGSDIHLSFGKESK